MLFSSLRVPLVAFVASAVTVSATAGLTLKISTPNANVDGLEDLKVTTTIINTGDEALKLLNDPRGVLDSFPENSFTITHASGSRASFTGAKVKYSPTYTAGIDDPNAFTVLAPGASIDVAHNLPAAYDFTTSGAGYYSIEPSNIFTYVDADGTLKNLYASVEDVVEVKLSGNLAVSRVHDKRATFNGCSSTRQSQINTAASSAQTYANRAYSYLQGISRSSSRYTTWFGTYSASRKSIVEDNFRLINSHKFSSFSYNCTCTNPSTYAYVYPDTFGKIYLCGAFWNAPNTGTNSKAGTLVHESSRFTNNGGAEDLGNCNNRNASQAIHNADCYEGFAENHPAL